jgi:Holliday junction resolvase RusA-like endonuclease
MVGTVSVMPASITFDVTGTPAPQGSKRAFVRGKRAVLVEMSTRVAPWRDAITTAALAASVPAGWLRTSAPVRVEVVFRVAAPKRPVKGRWSPSVRPDLDKLLRAVLDGLSPVIWDDDAQVIEVVARKRYVCPGEQSGASITITELDQPVAVTV